MFIIDVQLLFYNKLRILSLLKKSLQHSKLKINFKSLHQDSNSIFKQIENTGIQIYAINPKSVSIAIKIKWFTQPLLTTR